MRLEPAADWTFNIPKYHGVFKTMIRAELKYADLIDAKIIHVVYSNSVRGGVNPKQFWNQPEYSSRGLMDPNVELYPY